MEIIQLMIHLVASVSSSWYCASRLSATLSWLSGTESLLVLLIIHMVFPQICDQASVVSTTASLQSVLSQQGDQEGHHSRDPGGAEREGESVCKRYIMERNNRSCSEQGNAACSICNIINNVI